MKVTTTSKIQIKEVIKDNISNQIVIDIQESIDLISFDYPELTADLMDPEESLRLICVAFLFSISLEADSKVLDLRL